VVEASAEGQAWDALVDKSEAGEDLPHDYVELPAAAEARWVRLRVLEVPSGAVAVSGLRVFGLAPVDRPEQVEGLVVARGQDRREATVEWSPRPEAVGCVVRWGVGPEKLYNSAMVYGAACLELRCLQAEVAYFVSVEAFNGGGISSPAPAVGPF
jgi:hypothetical protein